MTISRSPRTLVDEDLRPSFVIIQEEMRRLAGVVAVDGGAVTNHINQVSFALYDRLRKEGTLTSHRDHDYLMAVRLSNEIMESVQRRCTERMLVPEFLLGMQYSKDIMVRRLKRDSS